MPLTPCPDCNSSDLRPVLRLPPVRAKGAAVARTSRGSGGEIGARRSAAIGAALVAIVLEVLCAAHANASPGSRCRHYCASAIDECQQQGEPRRRCRQRYVRLCKSSGFTACDLTPTTTSTTIAPPPPTTTITPTTTTTNTTNTTPGCALPAHCSSGTCPAGSVCGQLSGANVCTGVGPGATCTISQVPACGGTCPGGAVCGRASGANFCTCVDPSNTCEISQAPSCGGGCAAPGQVCGQASGENYCTCISTSDTCAISQVPACGATCPSGQICGQQSGTNRCICASSDYTCAISEAPACGGTCPGTMSCTDVGGMCGCG